MVVRRAAVAHHTSSVAAHKQDEDVHENDVQEDDAKKSFLLDEDDAEDATIQRSQIPWVVFQDGEIDPDGMAKTEVMTKEEIATVYGVPESVVDKYLTREVREAESCWSMPFTLLLVVSYMAMMITHLHSPDVRSVEHGMVHLIAQKARFAFTSETGHKNFEDINSWVDFWSWINRGLVPLVFDQTVRHPSEGRRKEDYNDLPTTWTGWTWKPPGQVQAPSPTSSASVDPGGAGGGVNNESTYPAPTEPAGNMSGGSVRGLQTVADDRPPRRTQALEQLYEDTYGHLSDAPRRERGHVMGYSRIVGGLRLRQERSDWHEDTDKCISVPDIALAFFRKSCVSGKNYELEPEVFNARRLYFPRRKEWLYVHDDLYVTYQRLAELETNGWLDTYTQRVEISMPFYNAEHGIHTLVSINFFFSRGGHIWKSILTESIIAELYDFDRNVIVYVFDLVWLGCLAWISVGEAREVISTVGATGITGLWTHYVSLWNTVDWISVISGIALIGLVAQRRHGASLLNELLAELAMVDEERETERYRSIADAYTTDVENLIRFDYVVRIFFAAYPVVIGLRLLKAFAAQPRLSLLTRTLYVAGSNLAHFLFVFIAIFYTFVVAAHILFGREAESYATFFRSAFSVFRATMGDYDWHEVVKVGRFEAGFWFVSFVVVVMMILFNILIAIIMDAYNDVKANLGPCGTLLDEVVEGYRRWLGHTRGELVPLQDVLTDIRKKRKLMPSLYSRSKKGVMMQGAASEIDDFLRPLLSFDGELRMVTVNFLRHNVTKMRGVQAAQILMDAIDLFYQQLKVDGGHEQAVHSMVLMLKELDFSTKEMKMQVANAANRLQEGMDGHEVSSDDDDDLACQQSMEPHISYADAKTSFLEQLRGSQDEMQRARLWIGLPVEDDENLVGTSSQGAGEEDSDSDADAASPEQRAADRAARADNLSQQAMQLESELSLGQRATAEAVSAVTELETRLLRSGEEVLDLEIKLRRTREQVTRLRGDWRQASQQAERGRAEARTAKQALGESFLDARELSEENVQLREQVAELKEARVRLQQQHVKECNSLRGAIAETKRRLVAEHEYALMGQEMRKRGFYDLWAYVEELVDADDFRSLGVMGASNTEVDMVTLIDAARTLLAQRENEIMSLVVPDVVLHWQSESRLQQGDSGSPSPRSMSASLSQKSWHDGQELEPRAPWELSDSASEDGELEGEVSQSQTSSESASAEDASDGEAASLARVLINAGVCADGTKCKNRDENHLATQAHPFDPDYAQLCKDLGVEPEEPSLRGLFDWVDVDSSGKITRFELEDAIPILSALLGEEFVISEQAYAKLDEDGNGVVNFSEFAEWAGPRLGLPLGVKKLFSGRTVDECHGCAVLNCPCEGFTLKPGQAPATSVAMKRLQLCTCGHKHSCHDMTLPSEGEVPYPLYWDARDSSQGDFSDLVPMNKESFGLFQTLLDATYQNIWTRDRTKHNPENWVVPSRYLVTAVFRAENSKVWREYGVRRAELITYQDPADTTFVQYKDVLSAVAWCEAGGALADRLKPECNEWYLFHGTDPAAAETICHNDFSFNHAGKASGTLYGRGIYFAESITKADEYAKADQSGEYAVLLCRVVGGRVRYTDELEPNPEELLRSCIEGPYDCIIGDRSKTRGTFREFVFYDTENFYAEYIIRYRRIYPSS